MNFAKRAKFVQCDISNYKIQHYFFFFYFYILLISVDFGNEVINFEKNSVNVVFIIQNLGHFSPTPRLFLIFTIQCILIKYNLMYRKSRNAIFYIILPMVTYILETMYGSDVRLLTTELVVNIILFWKLEDCQGQIISIQCSI